MTILRLLTLFLIFILAVPCYKGERFCRQGFFHQQVNEGKSLTKIISQHYVGSSLDCGQQCLHKKTCVAFKYRSKKSNEANCQIGEKLEGSAQADVTATKDSDWTVYKILNIESPLCLKNLCQNGGKCVGSLCEPDGYKCVCAENYRGKFCTEQVLAESCKSVLEMVSNSINGSFKIKTETPPIGFSNVYCQMATLPGCSGGGWTMVMKINGKMDTFRYNSSYWSNNSSYNLAGGLTGFDDQETKLPTYWSTPFKELCVGMKVGADLNFISINYTADSLYSLFADGRYRATYLGREKWMSLINNSSLQYECNQEGFNIGLSLWVYHTRTRLGIIGNEQSHCDSPDSFLGFGGKNGTIACHQDALIPTICGNLAYCEPDNGDKDIQAMGYILVR